MCDCLVSDVRTDGIYCQSCGRKLCGFSIEPATHYVDTAQMQALKERTAPLLQTANTELLEQIRGLEARVNVLTEALKPFAELVQVDEADGRLFVDKWHMAELTQLIAAYQALRGMA